MESILYKKKKVAYKENSGKGTPIVFLHGFCEDATMWDNFVEPFEQYRVIQMDLSGFGESHLLGEPTIQEMAKGVKALLDSLNIPQCVLIGHSMGGYVALAFASHWEERLLGLGLFHSHPFADTETVKKNRQKSIDFIKRNGHILFVKQLMNRLFPKGFNNDFLIGQMVYKASRYSATAIIAGTKAMMDRTDHSHTLAHLSCPVLMIIGQLDEAVPYELSSKMMQLPRLSQIEIMSNVGHMGMFEEQRKTQQMVKKFIAFIQKMTVSK